MDNLFSVDWASLFKPTVPLAEIVVRGTVIYLLLFLFLSHRDGTSAGQLEM